MSGMGDIHWTRLRDKITQFDAEIDPDLFDDLDRFHRAVKAHARKKDKE